MPVSKTDEDKDGISFNVDVNKVISDVFGTNKDRNNLAVQIENGAEFGFLVNYHVVHGVTSAEKGSPDLAPAEKIAPSYTVGLEAKGEGCNIVIWLDFENKNYKPVSFMAATPSNKQNYIKYDPDRKKITAKEIQSEVGDEEKRYSENGPTYVNLKTTNSGIKSEYFAMMNITGASPAVCMFRIKKGVAPNK